MADDTIQALIIFVAAPLIIVGMILAANGCESNRADYKIKCFKETQSEKCWELGK